MSTFTDSSGRAWPVDLDFPTMSAIKKQLGVDLMTEEGLRRLGELKGIEDYELVSQVLYLAYREACDTHGVSDEDFGRLASRHFVDAVKAFNEGLVDFFRRVGMRPMAMLIERAMAMQSSAESMVSTQISANTIDRLLTKSLSITELQLESQLSLAESEMDTILGNASPNSEPSAGSSTSSPAAV